MKRNLLYHFMIGLMFLFTRCSEKEIIEPYAYFIPSATVVKVGDIITFNNQSKGAESFEWDFDDGSTSIRYSPVHSYDKPGQYNVLLIANNKSKNKQHELVIKVEINDQPVEACFTMSRPAAKEGQIVSFSNCSDNANSYSWDFGDGETSTLIDPAHIFISAGTYTVVLTAYGNRDSFTYQKTITILEYEEPDFDPYDYNSMPSGGWNTRYYDDFSKADTKYWYIDTVGKLSLNIKDGRYIVKNRSYSNGFIFWAKPALMPGESENFDFEVYLKIDQDDSMNGVGFTWGIDILTNELFYYLYTQYNNDVWFIYGSTYEVWSPGGWGTGGNYGGYNKLSVRKYQNTYYFFMNEKFLGVKPFEIFYGEYFGFFIGARAEMEVEEYGIYTMIFNSKKSVSEKTNIPTPDKGKGFGFSKVNSVVKFKQ